jgi:hypothetical protein
MCKHLTEAPVNGGRNYNGPKVVRIARCDAHGGQKTGDGRRIYVRFSSFPFCPPIRSLSKTWLYAGKSENLSVLENLFLKRGFQ